MSGECSEDEQEVFLGHSVSAAETCLRNLQQIDLEISETDEEGYEMARKASRRQNGRFAHRAKRLLEI